MTGTTMTLCASHAPGFARDHKAREGLEFRQGLREAADAVRDFGPDLVVYFGSDHRTAFTDTVPGISVVLGAEGLGDRLSPTGEYKIPAGTAQDLAGYLLTERFDIAVTRRVALDHGFGQTAGELFGTLDAVPMIPVFINCATRPFVPPARSVELGEAVGRFFAARDERVLFLASGGLSHSPPVLAVVSEPVPMEEALRLSAQHREKAKDLIRPEWDRRFLSRLGEPDTRWAHALTQADIDPAGIGADEVRTWLAAYAAGRKPLRTVAYEPVREWVTGVGVAISGYEAMAR